MNTSIEVQDALELVPKLIETTRENKLNWQHTGENNESYTALLGDDLRVSLEATSKVIHFSIEKSKTVAAQVLQPPEQIRASSPVFASGPVYETILEITLELKPKFGFDSNDQMLLADLLSTLYVVAKRNVLQANESVNSALSYLEKLAG